MIGYDVLTVVKTYLPETLFAFLAALIFWREDYRRIWPRVLLVAVLFGLEGIASYTLFYTGHPVFRSALDIVSCLVLIKLITGWDWEKTVRISYTFLFFIMLATIVGAVLSIQILHSSNPFNDPNAYSIFVAAQVCNLLIAYFLGPFFAGYMEPIGEHIQDNQYRPVYLTLAFQALVFEFLVFGLSKETFYNLLTHPGDTCS